LSVYVLVVDGVGVPASGGIDHTGSLFRKRQTPVAHSIEFHLERNVGAKHMSNPEIHPDIHIRLGPIPLRLVVFDGFGNPFGFMALNKHIIESIFVGMLGIDPELRYGIAQVVKIHIGLFKTQNRSRGGSAPFATPEKVFVSFFAQRGGAPSSPAHKNDFPYRKIHKGAPVIKVFLYGSVAA
jgi:hypothetical protein